jgi:hypothetical protein
MKLTGFFDPNSQANKQEPLFFEDNSSAFLEFSFEKIKLLGSDIDRLIFSICIFSLI